MENTEKVPAYWSGIKTLLTISKIIFILSIVSIGIYMTVAFINAIVYFALNYNNLALDFSYLKDVYNNPEAFLNGLAAQVDVLIVAVNAATSIHLIFSGLPSIIVSLVFVNIVLKNYPKVTLKSEATKYAVYCIVAGYLSGIILPYPAAALIFIRKRSDFPGEVTEEENITKIPEIEENNQ